MPDYVTIHCDVHCPYCNNKIGDSIDIQWGKVPHDYSIGDEVIWLKDGWGEIAEPFTLRLRNKNYWNCGDPEFKNVFVFDSYIFDQDSSFICPICSKIVPAVIAVIENGIIEKIKALTTEEIEKMLGNKIGSVLHNASQA